MNPHVVRKSGMCLSAETYREYRGQWIALSPDGTRIVAHADALDLLEDRLVAIGEDREKVIFDRVEDDDTLLGGSDLL